MGRFTLRWERSLVKPDVDDRRPGLPPPRFSLAALFWLIGVLGVLFAAMGYFGSHATLLLIVLALAVFAHVAANALGTRLRENGNRRMDGEGKPVAGPAAWQRVAKSDFAPATRLRERSALGKPAVIATIVGAVLGGVLGGFGLTLVMQRITVTTVVLGVFASAVLGGVWSFLAASFCQVALGAAWQAVRAPDKSRSPADE